MLPKESDSNWDQILSEIIAHKFQNKVQLDNFLRCVFGVYLASRPIDDGNSSPLDFVWDIYSSAVEIAEKPTYNFVAMAGRGTQKSLSGGVIETLMLLIDPVRDWFHCAAIMDQSERTYNYVQSFFSKPFLSSVVDGEPKMKETKTIHGTRLQIGTGTIKSVSGFHGSVVLDEYDLMDKIVTKMAKGMLSAQKGHRPFEIYLSSRYFNSGNVESLMASHKTSNVDTKIHKWGVLEMTERCPDSWSGKKKVNIWVNEDDLIAYNEDDYKRLDSIKKNDFNELEGFENCVACGIFSFCKGNLKKQQTREENPYLEPLAETISKFKNNDTETFKSQRLNRKPSSRNLMYQWDEDIHVLTIVEAVELITGEPCLNKEADLEYLISLCISKNLEFNYGADPGYTESAAGLYVIDDLERTLMLDEITVNGYSEGEFALAIWKRWGHLPLQNGFPDQIPTFMKDLKADVAETGKGSLPVSNKVDKSSGSVDSGIATVRRILRVPGTKRTQFHCLSHCAMFRYQMANYKRKMDPKTDQPTDHVIKKEDHHPDQFRYFAHTRLGKQKSKVTMAAAQPIQQSFKPNSSVRAPTAEELAQTVGVSGFKHNTDIVEDGLPKKKSRITYSV